MIVVKEARLEASLLKILPTIQTWSRVEVDPNSPDLAPSLRAEIADPLWALHRQWAFGELDAEDAGSPIDVRLEGNVGTVTRFAPGVGARRTAIDFDQIDAPLEAAIEAESLVASHRRYAAMLGQRLLRRLRAAGAATTAQRFVDAFPLKIAEPDDLAADPSGAAWSRIGSGRAIDGAVALDGVRNKLRADGTVSAPPDGIPIPSAERAAVVRVLNEWIAQIDATVVEPDTDVGSSWQPSRMEYRFALSAQLPGGAVTLRSDEYTDGRLDWYSFDASTTPALGDPDEPIDPTVVSQGPMIPSPVRYPGMPADRFWEFEDRIVNFGALQAGPTDLTRLLLVEYGLAFGNDWFVVPVDLALGSLFSVDHLTVTDTFGITTSVEPSRNETGGPNWEMFELAVTGRSAARARNLFFLPPALPRRFESPPVEEVNLLRDEMANLAWGVERRVMGAAGDPVDRAVESSRLPTIRQELDGTTGDAQLVYRLASEVPANWIPFAPVAAAPIIDPAFEVALERRVLLRTLADGSTVEVHPRGELLRNDRSRPVETEPPLRIEEGEVPRSGAIVTRSVQLVRWLDGSRRLWLGRAKRTGRGEGASNLRFDQPEEPH